MLPNIDGQKHGTTVQPFFIHSNILHAVKTYFSRKQARTRSANAHMTHIQLNVWPYAMIWNRFQNATIFSDVFRAPLV